MRAILNLIETFIVSLFLIRLLFGHDYYPQVVQLIADLLHK
jgi:hypothetical protein